MDSIIFWSWSTQGLNRFNPTIGPTPNRSFPDPRPLLDLIILRFWSSLGLNRLTPTIGQSPTWLCCDPGPFPDRVDFSSAISAGVIRYGLLDIGAVPGSSSAMNGSALSGGMPCSARNTSSNSLTSRIPSGLPPPRPP